MKTPHRIGIHLLDDSLQTLINASSKIFPVDYAYVTANTNPNNYEYVRVVDGEHKKEIYIWQDGAFSLIGADDKEVDFNTEVINKPLSYPPSEHSHAELHSHNNKSIIDTITQNVIDTWNSVTNKAEAVHSHDDLYYTEDEVDTKLLGKADTEHTHSEYQLAGSYAQLEHNHDELYNTKQQITALLEGKANTVHSHPYASETHNHDGLYADISVEAEVSDHENRLYAIENGYTEGHSHENLTVLNIITQSLIDGWNSAVTHIGDAVKHITSEERNLWNTVGNKAESNHNHDSAYSAIGHNHDSSYASSAHNHDTVYAAKTHNHDANYAALAHNHTKAQITDFPVNVSVFNNDAGYVKITQGTVKPSSGYWFKEVV